MGGHERVFIQMKEPDASVTWLQASKEKTQNIVMTRESGGVEGSIYAFGDPSHQIVCRPLGRRDWTRCTLHGKIPISGDCANAALGIG